MNKKYRKSLFVFRRDLRVPDNTALLEAGRLSEKLVPIFIFDSRQVDRNPYKSMNAIQFMFESLVDLDSELQERGGRLFCWQGKSQDVVAQLIKAENIDAVFVNKDYTPFALNRDDVLSKICRGYEIAFESFDDALLAPPGTVLKKDGKPYTIFTPFYKTASKLTVEKPRNFRHKGCFAKRLRGSQKISEIDVLPETNSRIFARGGRKEGLKLLKRAAKLKSYDEQRNLPAVNGTTGLSAHNKFGTVSAREVYHRVAKSFGSSHTIIQELYWRDFFTHIGFFFPRVFKSCFYSQYDKIEWENDRKKFQAWCKGQTGFPIVDAGMRELNTTGFMHNRVRMVVASFLTKDLHIDWRWGEKYFAQKLVDYDPSVNNGNWQWAASTGCDAQPYFRIFNPWRQQERFDSDCVYIKYWLPELAEFSSKEIHSLPKKPIAKGYVPPIVEHRDAAAVAEDLYIEARSKEKRL